jgi:pimeloyl-ACP methyl ester carboxylesterase
LLSAPNLAKGHLAGDARDAELAAWLTTADIGIPVSRAAIADRLLAPTAPALVRCHVERLRDALTTDGWRQAIGSLFTIHTPDVIAEISCPIAILSGTHDQAAPYEEHAARLLAAAPSAKSYPIQGCGHMLKLEAPGEFNAVAREMAAERSNGTVSSPMPP